jgi:hypothetical protein
MRWSGSTSLLSCTPSAIVVGTSTCVRSPVCSADVISSRPRLSIARAIVPGDVPRTLSAAPKPGEEAEYLLLEDLPDVAITYNVERMRRASFALQKHLDALEVCGLNRRRAALSRWPEPVASCDRRLTPMLDNPPKTAAPKSAEAATTTKRIAQIKPRAASTPRRTRRRRRPRNHQTGLDKGV